MQFCKNWWGSYRSAEVAKLKEHDKYQWANQQKELLRDGKRWRTLWKHFAPRSNRTWVQESSGVTRYTCYNLRITLEKQFSLDFSHSCTEHSEQKVLQGYLHDKTALEAWDSASLQIDNANELWRNKALSFPSLEDITSILLLTYVYSAALYFPLYLLIF